MPDRPVTVFGGTGFLGATLVRELVEAGRPVRLVARRPARPAWAEAADPLELVAADIRRDDAVAAALDGAAAVVNAVSLYVQTRRLSFETIHVEGAGRLARLAREAGIERLIHVSGIGADHTSPSAYVRARAHGEAAVLETMPRAIIVRPSVLFGPQDAFLGSLAGLTRLPVIPLFGRGETRLQPVHVVDLARALARLTGEPGTPRRLFEFGGSEAMTYRQILELVLAHLGRERPLLPVPFPAWRVLAAFTGRLPNPPLTRDQVILMSRDNVVGDGVGTFDDLGIAPRSLRESLPNCLTPTGR
ncbi:complex I NDUFA9 subunit family protein [Halomonas cerina]|uniref:NADH dehydrogenase n=1 Tax=Halomonas cerina TaxID=447424 RepID=A0A839V751_9GAMM|nr:complex I NDUFA9 subunit family protein [Halomonas cerina]MBB3189858.1 NADH dehydrogenase [Halomonas cerina]